MTDFGLIAKEVALTLDDFEALLKTIIKCDQVEKDSWHDAFIRELDRFKVWVGNIGAHKHGQSSLDFRLRDASHIRGTVLELLSSLRQSLQEASLVASGASWDSSSSDSDSDSEIEDLGGSPTQQHELIHIRDYVRGAIRSLLRLSMTIENPAPRDRYLAARSTYVQQFEPVDISHVRSKLPDAPGYLLTRLGKAISARRQFLSYSEKHRSRLKAGLFENLEADRQSTIATSLPPDIASGHIIPDLPLENDDLASLTSFATTIAGSGQLTIPPFPENAAYEEEFECTLCYCIVYMTNRGQWKSHVFEDLQPYVCPVKRCLMGNRTFPHRREWKAHLQTHKPSDLDYTTCPLCYSHCLSQREWLTHVGREMQQLALFAVPKSLYRDENESEHEDDVFGLTSPQDLDGPITAELKQLRASQYLDSLKEPPSQGFDSSFEDHSSDEDQLSKTHQVQFMDELPGTDYYERHAPKTQEDSPGNVKVGFAGVTGISRPLTNEEHWTLFYFENHAAQCDSCHDPLRVANSGKRLCSDGHELAIDVAELLLYRQKDDEVYSRAKDGEREVRVEIPHNYEQTLSLLKAINRATRKGENFPGKPKPSDRTYKVDSRLSSEKAKRDLHEIEAQPVVFRRSYETKIDEQRPPQPPTQLRPQLRQRERESSESMPKLKRGSLYKEDLERLEKAEKHEQELRYQNETQGSSSREPSSRKPRRYPTVYP